MKGRIVAALLLLAVGTAWLLDLLGYTLFPGGFGTWWPAILILVGLVGIALEPRRWQGPALLVLLGCVLQLWTLGLIRDDWWAFLAPVALIVIAVFLLLPGRHRTRVWPPAAPAPGRPGEASRPGRDNAAIFSTSRLAASPGDRYQGGEVTAVFGELDLDLAHAALPPEGARLKATSVFGRVHLRVPPEWRVEIRGRPILGETTDRTRGSPTGPVLDVDATAIFGEVHVTNP